MVAEHSMGNCEMELEEEEVVVVVVAEEMKIGMVEMMAFINYCYGAMA